MELCKCERGGRRRTRPIYGHAVHDVHSLLSNYHAMGVLGSFTRRVWLFVVCPRRRDDTRRRTSDIYSIIREGGASLLASPWDFAGSWRIDANVHRDGGREPTKASYSIWNAGLTRATPAGVRVQWAATGLDLCPIPVVGPCVTSKSSRSVSGSRREY